MRSKLSSSSGFQQRSSLESGGIINNPKRQKSEATKKHFVNLSAHASSLTVMKKSQKLEAARYLTFDSFTTHQLFNKYLQKKNASLADSTEVESKQVGSSTRIAYEHIIIIFFFSFLGCHNNHDAENFHSKILNQ
jgi:hypothetical protein